MKRETSPAARSEEKLMFSQAILNEKEIALVLIHVLNLYIYNLNLERFPLHRYGQQELTVLK